MGNAKRSGALAAVAAAVVCLREWREGGAIAAAGWGSASAQRCKLTAGAAWPCAVLRLEECSRACWRLAAAVAECTCGNRG